MNRYPIIIIIFVVVFFKSGYGQARLPVGIYEVGDTTIEVYNWKDPYVIREFKIINGTETILYRSFSRITKKLQEEGAFKGGYSSGKWKFYGWTGRLKKEINYDNMVKTCYEKKVELNPEELFDFAKFKEDSIFVDKLQKQKMLAAKKNVIHDTVYIEKAPGLSKGILVNKTAQKTAGKPVEAAKVTPTPAEPAPVKAETPTAIAAQPAAIKTTEPAKSAPTPAQPTPLKKEAPTAVAAQPAGVKTTEPAKTVTTLAQPAPVKKEAPAAVATQSTGAKTTEPPKPASAPAQPAPVKMETPTAVVAQPAGIKTPELAKALPAPAQPAPVKKEAPAAVATQPTGVKTPEPSKAAPTPAQPVSVKKEIPAAVATQPAAVKKNEATKIAPASTKPESTKKKAIEEDTKANDDDKKREPEPEPTPVKQQAGAAMIEQQQEDKQTEVSEEKVTATSDDQQKEPESESIHVYQTTAALIEQQQENKETEVSDEKKITVVADEQKNEQQATLSDSIQQEPAEGVIKKAEKKQDAINQNHYYGCRANGNWYEISNVRPNEFMMRYDTRTEDKMRFSFFEFALDSIGKLKKEKVIRQVSDLKKQDLLKFQFIDSLALVYGMQAMDKPFSHVLEYTIDSTQTSNARFQLYITGMPYNKKTEENRITEPFDFIVLDPWTGELITKGNGNAVTDNDSELNIRMTTLIKNQDVQ